MFDLFSVPAIQQLYSGNFDRYFMYSCFQDGGRFVSFVMSENKASSTVSEGCSDNLELVQEVFGKYSVNCIVSTANQAWKVNEKETYLNCSSLIMTTGCHW